MSPPPVGPGSTRYLSYGALLLAGVAGACDARIIDDYRESAIIIQGTVNAAGGPAIVGAVLEFTADTPRYLCSAIRPLQISPARSAPG